MKKLRTTLLTLLVVAPLLLPTQTKAEGFWDWLFGGNEHHHKDGGNKDGDRGDRGGDKNGRGDKGGGDCNNGKGGNSAPIDGGLAILLVVGAGLGAKMVYDHNKRETVKVPVS